jgi:hypothetical protein
VLLHQPAVVVRSGGVRPAGSAGLLHPVSFSEFIFYVPQTHPPIDCGLRFVDPSDAAGWHYFSRID